LRTEVGWLAETEIQPAPTSVKTARPSGPVLAAIVFARAVLGIFIDFTRPVAFFRALAGITDPFIALFAPITPGFLHPAFHSFYAAFCLYFIKMMIFGGFGAPPPWVFILLALG
jgi:uncharacterized protein YggT (Ycf19 family)